MKRLLVLMLVGVMLLVGCSGAEEPATAPVTPLVDRLAAVENELVRLASKIAGAPDVSALETELKALREEVSALRAELEVPSEELNEQIIALEERLEALEEEKQEEEEGDVDSEDAVEVDVRYSRELRPKYGTDPLEPFATAGKTFRLSGKVYIELENQLSVAIEDIVLSARIRVTSETSGIEVVNVELVGDDIEWDDAGSNEFESWGDIKLGANSDFTERSTLYVTVANVSDAPIGNFLVSIEQVRVDCEDYEVKK